MKRADVSTKVSDDDVAPNLRPFIDILLDGDREGYSFDGQTERNRFVVFRKLSVVSTVIAAPLWPVCPRRE
jgi:hypothetical protein